jgi:hypothetical protein
LGMKMIGLRLMMLMTSDKHQPLCDIFVYY